MKYSFLILSIVALGIVSCKKDPDNGHYPKGVYKGTFKRYHEPASQEAQVTITFNYPNWSGTSNIEKYPALGNGKFNYKHEALNFTNANVWTADFDWTLILNGQYIERREGDSLIFTKSYGNGKVDVYKLKKQ